MEILFEAKKNKIKIMGKGTNFTVLCVKQAAELQQNYHPECIKTHHIETRNQLTFATFLTPIDRNM